MDNARLRVDRGPSIADSATHMECLQLGTIKLSEDGVSEVQPAIAIEEA
jgi:hypothetical protein